MIKRAKNLVQVMTKFLENHYHLMLILVLISYFARSLTLGLLKGGRWDLYQNIAMADRYLAGQGLYYSSIEASSPYFPGVAFLSIFVGKFFNPWRDYILLFIASLIGTAFFYVLIKLGEKFSGNGLLSMVTIFLLLSIGFDSYRSYMNEFKADSAVLLVAVFIVMVIDGVEQKIEKVNIKTCIWLFLLSFIMDIMKQQALYVDVALGMYLLFTKRLKAREKIMLLGSLVFAGILDLIIVFSIPGTEIQTIQNLSDMPYRNIKSIILQMRSDFLAHKEYFVLLFLFVYLLVSKKIKLKSFARKWLIVAMMFGGGQILGGWKIGGNAGNYEAGMVSFLPFVAMAVVYFFEEYFVKEKKKIILSIANYITCGLCLVILANVGYRSKSVVAKIHVDNEVSTYLSENFDGETLMYYSNQYMQIARSTAKPGMDVYSVPSNVKEYWHTIEECLKNQTYKYLYVKPTDFKNWDKTTMTFRGKESNAAGMLDKYYTEIKDTDMPESLKGQLYIAK